MRQQRDILIWIVIGALSVLTVAWTFPQTFPFVHSEWNIDRAEAISIALERLRDLGEPVENPYLVVEFRSGLDIERRLQESWETIDRSTFPESSLAQTLASWTIRIYPPGALSGQWTYFCRISRSGKVLGLLKRVPGNNLPEQDAGKPPEPLDEDDARQQARQALKNAGFNLADFDTDPTLQRLETANERELRVRYRYREQRLGERYPYGIEVRFSGSEYLGFTQWFEDPEPDTARTFFRQAEWLEILKNFMLFLLLPFVIVPFLKRYHDGQLGVRRGVHFFLVFWVVGVLFLLLCARALAADTNVGGLTREQTTMLVSLWILIFFFSSNGVLALTSWAVGESFCRELWPQKLASIDALFRGKWTNSTVAFSALRGLAGGSAMAALSLLFGLKLRDAGAWMMSGSLFNDSLTAPLPGLSVVTSIISFNSPLYLLAGFLIPCWLGTWIGPNRGLLPACLLAAVILNPFAIAFPIQWGFLGWLVVAAIPVLLFRFGDLLSTLLAGLAAPALIALYPLLTANDSGLQTHGYLALIMIASPLIVSLRWLGTGHEFLYTYDDIPPHVRRIADRERQRVELETAAQIQTSILPQLPPQVNGFEIAHTYLPASEVGGDFYDVLALEDGRIALAVGDVAGHGVSSGLVMSMAKSALAVQVTFDPEVESVIHTLNRMVYQSARRRLLTTLCYAVVDPKELALHYASAGHLYPYQISLDGDVRALEESSYPLGVRQQLEVRPRMAKLHPGDSIFLYSDGLVEAKAENSEEPFGFDRLENSLGRHAGKTPRQMRDAVLADVEAYTGHNRNDDDVTILVLRLPAA